MASLASACAHSTPQTVTKADPCVQPSLRLRRQYREVPLYQNCIQRNNLIDDYLQRHGFILLIFKLYLLSSQSIVSVKYTSFEALWE